MESRGARQIKETARNTSPSTWSALAVLALAMAAGGITARLEAGPRFDWLLLMTAMGLTAAVAMRLLADSDAEHQARARYQGDPLRDLLDSAGTVIVSLDMEGRLAFVNPAGERLLGYYASELVNESSARDLLAPGELDRLTAELQKISGIQPVGDENSSGTLETFQQIVRALPPSQIPPLEANLQRKNGEMVPVRLHVSSMRNSTGDPVGLVVVAQEYSAAERNELLRKEPRDRARDVFESSTEMIATLDLTGKFMYVNPAWKQCFQNDHGVPVEHEYFDEAFGAAARAEATALLNRVLDGETIDRAALRNETADGQLQELEVSMHQRRRAGKPMAVQCLVRDVTQQKQREHRLSLQLLVTQIVGENVSAEMAAMRVLEALCISQGWDMAVKWDVHPETKRLEFSTAWGLPGAEIETFIQESMGITLEAGQCLAGRALKEGRLVWVTDLEAEEEHPRAKAAVRHKMVSGWAAPVQVGDSILAVLEFYCHYKLREDREMTAAMETVAASLGQMLARARERERADELSRQQKILLHSVADGICGVDRNGTVRFANPAATRLLGVPSPSLIGKTVHEILHGNAPEGKKCGADCALRRATAQRVPATGEDTVYRSNASGFPAEYFLNPMIDQGRYSGSVLSFRDISQRYALDKMKDEFVSTVSHELRTPLTSIRGALGLLTSGILGPISDKATNLLRIALTNSDRLVRLINDILDLERAQSGREPLVFRSVQMADLVRQAIDGMQLVAEQAGVLLIHDKTQVEITADADRLLQVLTNLLSNAVKFSPRNSAVSVMLRPGSSGVTLSVIDQGRGIPADKLEAVFGRFQQVDASDSRQKGGSGLGLAICRAIVMQHNGRIWAERNPVRGSTFRVFLPYHPAAAAKRKPAHPQMAGQGVVLLASSNGATRPLIGAQLADYGYRILETNTMEQTLVAAHDGVEAIVLDTAVNGLNGWEVLPQLRRSTPEAYTPVVLLSLDTQQGVNGRNGDGEPVQAKHSMAMGDLARVLAGSDESVRILVVESDARLAGAVTNVFAGDGVLVKAAKSRREAMDECLSLQPHLLVLNIRMTDGEAFHLVDWLRDQEILARVPLVIYSGAELTPEAREQLMKEPTNLLTKARVQPHQLETLVLTMLRSPRQVDAAMVEVAGARRG